MIPTAGNCGIRASVACVNLKWMCVSVMTQLFVHHYKNTKADSFLAQSSLFFLPLRLNPCVHNRAVNTGNAERREAETRLRRLPASLNVMKVRAQRRRRRRDKHPDICHLPSTCHHFQEGPVSGAVSVSIGIFFPSFFSAPHHLSPSRCL